MFAILSLRTSLPCLSAGIPVSEMYLQPIANATYSHLPDAPVKPAGSVGEYEAPAASGTDDHMYEQLPAERHYN